MRLISVKNIIIAAAASVLLTGCAGASGNSYRLYFTDASGSKLTVDNYVTNTKDTVELAKELLAGLESADNSDRSVVIKPADVLVEKVGLQEDELIITFSDNYKDMDDITEAMYRTAVVKTVAQIEDIKSVSFYDSKGVVVLPSGMKLSSLKSDDYIDDSNDVYSDTSWMSVGLYYTNELGTTLIRTDANIAYNQNETIEKMIVSRLVDGPVEEGLYPVIPEDTKLISVSLRNGICYVNFDSLFVSGNVNASGNLPVYAVVNSLCELEEVDEVRILIDGSSDVVFRESLSLDKNLTFDNSYISK